MFRFAAYYIFIFLIINLVTAMLVHNDIGAEFLMIPPSLASFVLFKRKSDSLIMLMLFMLACAAGEILKYYIEPTIILEEKFRLAFYYTNIFIAFIVAGTIITSFKIVIEDYEKTVDSQKRELEERNKDITDSIRYAKRIQNSLMPTEKYFERVLGGKKKDKIA